MYCSLNLAVLYYMYMPCDLKVMVNYKLNYQKSCSRLVGLAFNFWQLELGEVTLSNSLHLIHIIPLTYITFYDYLWNLSEVQNCGGEKQEMFCDCKVRMSGW